MLMRFSSPLAASDVIVFRQRVIKNVQYAFLDNTAFFVHRVAERIDQTLRILQLLFYIENIINKVFCYLDFSKIAKLFEINKRFGY